MFHQIKLARFNFKNALQSYRTNQWKIRKAKLLPNFHFGHESNFWLEVRNVNAVNKHPIQCIDDISKPVAAVELFERNFMQI